MPIPGKAILIPILILILRSGQQIRLHHRPRLLLFSPPDLASQSCRHPVRTFIYIYIYIYMLHICDWYIHRFRHGHIAFILGAAEQYNKKNPLCTHFEQKFQLRLLLWIHFCLPSCVYVPVFLFSAFACVPRQLEPSLVIFPCFMFKRNWSTVFCLARRMQF